jgi:SLT domain-containing protein
MFSNVRNTAARSAARTIQQTIPQDKIPAVGFNKVEAAQHKKHAAIKVMKQNKKFDKRFERRTVILPLLIGCTASESAIPD